MNVGLTVAGCLSNLCEALSGEGTWNQQLHNKALLVVVGLLVCSLVTSATVLLFCSIGKTATAAAATKQFSLSGPGRSPEHLPD